ncbi:uncharacterized protein LOC121110836 isoform X2 [Gallus gallus]|uniref:uncharacterized protein LOC121110836 isoform X2 n=1 Tax=Gallus gallus TaxID=9031 RepID=UPI001AE5922E|nr:uncharacterized protein LOC121110836 isoform X2 [Gallus gallus]
MWQGVAAPSGPRNLWHRRSSSPHQERGAASASDRRTSVPGERASVLSWATFHAMEQRSYAVGCLMLATLQPRGSLHLQRSAFMPGLISDAGEASWPVSPAPCL